MCCTHGATSSAVGAVRDSGVNRGGIGRVRPPSPTTSGSAPRFDATTGMPFSIASAATRPNDSFHSEGISTSFDTR